MEDRLDKLAGTLQEMGLEHLAGMLDAVANTMEHSAAIPRGEFVFPADHPKVIDDKDHFPINTIGRGRNALARANGFDRSPEWYKGSLSQLKADVASAVSRRWPSVDISEKALD